MNMDQMLMMRKLLRLERKLINKIHEEVFANLEALRVENGDYVGVTIHLIMILYITKIWTMQIVL